MRWDPVPPLHPVFQLQVPEARPVQAPRARVLAAAGAGANLGYMATVGSTSSPVDFPGGVRVSKGTITFDSSYPTGGEVVTPAQFGADAVGLPGRKPDFVLFNTVTPTTTSLAAQYIKATGKVTTYGTAASAIGVTEVGSGQSLAAATTTVEFLAFWVNPGATVDTVAAT